MQEELVSDSDLSSSSECTFSDEVDKLAIDLVEDDKPNRPSADETSNHSDDAAQSATDSVLSTIVRKSKTKERL